MVVNLVPGGGSSGTKAEKPSRTRDAALSSAGAASWALTAEPAPAAAHRTKEAKAERSANLRIQSSLR